jgi:hypothetical protein
MGCVLCLFPHRSSGEVGGFTHGNVYAGKHPEGYRAEASDAQRPDQAGVHPGEDQLPRILPNTRVTAFS